MGLFQPYTDPVTGAFYGSTYSVVVDVQIDFKAPQATVYSNRYVGIDTYSLGLSPLQSYTSVIVGTQWQAVSPQITTFFQNFRQNLANRAQTYIAGIPTFSGFTATLPAPPI